MKISVVIPAYNSAATLAAAVRSARRQTLPAEEILVVDDGSTDDTPAICAGLGPDVRFVRRENGGLAAARNTGAAHTTGEWLLFLDSDDTLYPHALEILAEAAGRIPKARVVYGFVLQRRGPGEDTRLHSLPGAAGEPPRPAKAMFWWTAISTAGCALVHRSLHDAVGGFDENFRQVEDAEYWLRCGVTAPFAHCNQIVLDKGYSPSSLGGNTARSIWYRLQLQLKFLLWCDFRGIDPAFLKLRRGQIFDHAITRAYREHTWTALAPITDLAITEKVWTKRVVFASLHGSMVAPGAEKYPVVYRRWLDEARGISPPC